MLLRRNFDKRTGIYRSKDAIEHFRFRVHLKTLNSFVKVPKFNADLASDDEDSDEVVSEEFVWQQKRLSARELEQFKHLENCKTDEQKRYHQTIVDGGQTVSRIFSYVMDDQFTPPEDEPTECGDNDIIANVENFGDWHGSAAIQRGKLFVDIEENQSVLRSRYKNLGKFDVMHIMADLENEVVLATIKYRANDGLLLIYPDFNAIDSDPYFREINSDSRHIYQYSIENLSTDRRHFEWSLKNDMSKLANKLSDLSMKSSSVFDLPPRHQRFVCICMEIESAEEFDYDHIHIKYRFIVPKQCRVLDGGTEGSTHSSHRKRDLNGRWLIGFCHELNIECGVDYQFNDHLKMFCEVVSIDWWSRERTEGYAMTTIPMHTKAFVETVTCFRDLGNDTWLEWMERYFIGGRRKVLLDQFFANTGETKSMLNRYGNKTKTTGQLNIKWNVIVQRDIGKTEKQTDVSRNRHANRRQLAITSVLEAYREARERLEDIMS